ncbi:MAG: hypothetical protein ACLGG5_09160 [Thermoleophilia bacterium]
MESGNDQEPELPATPQPTVAEATKAVAAELQKASEAIKRAEDKLRG